MFPTNISPMPLRRHPEPSSHRDWVYEIKHDGFRALAFIKDCTCRLVSRNGNPFHSFATLNIAIPEELHADRAVLDGDIVCLDEEGRSQFDELLFRRGEPRFYAFDLVWCGRDLRYDPLHERKLQLKAFIRAVSSRFLEQSFFHCA